MFSAINRLVIVVIVYFVVGMIIMRVKYDKTGSDIIPNKTFWMSLPFLVKVNNYYTTVQLIMIIVFLSLFIA